MKTLCPKCTAGLTAMSDDCGGTILVCPACHWQEEAQHDNEPTGLRAVYDQFKTFESSFAAVTQADMPMEKLAQALWAAICEQIEKENAHE